MDNTVLKDEKTIEILNLNLNVEVEELEERIAPGLRVNHNETLVRDSDAIPGAVEIEIEELEPIIAPGHGINHNETLLRDVEN